MFGFYFLRDLGFIGLTLRAWVFVKTILLKSLLTTFVKKVLNNKKGCFYRGITLFPPYKNFVFEIKSFQNQRLNNYFLKGFAIQRLKKKRRKDNIKHAKNKYKQLYIQAALPPQGGLRL
jgi:hypothetical protein